MVANELCEMDNGIYSTTTLDMKSECEPIDFNRAKESIQILSENWSWCFSSVSTTQFTTCMDGQSIEITFINASFAENEESLYCSFYVMGDSSKEASDKVRAITSRSSRTCEITNVEEYFKTDQCYIVSTRIRLDFNDIEEVRRILLHFADTWHLTGLEANAGECSIDQHIKEMKAIFRNAVF